MSIWNNRNNPYIAGTVHTIDRSALGAGIVQTGGAPIKSGQVVIIVGNSGETPGNNGMSIIRKATVAEIIIGNQLAIANNAMGMAIDGEVTYTSPGTSGAFAVPLTLLNSNSVVSVAITGAFTAEVGAICIADDGTFKVYDPVDDEGKLILGVPVSNKRFPGDAVEVAKVRFHRPIQG